MIGETVAIGEYVAILRRRKWYIVFPSILVMAIAAVVAIVWPPVYRSSATILIESPDVPPELVASTITGFVEQQIQTINQRVTSTQRLIDIINRFNLYPDQRKLEPIFSVAERMREDISLDLMGAQPGARKPVGQSATVAFTLSYDYGNPQIAQRVANELVSLYLSENARSRQEKASETTAFLASEANRLERQIAELDRQLSDIKQRYQGSLPDQLQYNLEQITRLEEQGRALELRAQSLTDRQIYLESQLALMDPFELGAATPGSSADAQLQSMRTTLVALSGRYGPEHPDVIKLRREVDALEKEQGGSGALPALQAERDRLKGELTILKERYAEDHPDVAATKRQLASIESELATASQQRGNAATPRVRNPIYIKLQAEVKAAQSEMTTVKRQHEQLLAQVSEIEKKVMQTPLVERQYLTLVRDYDAAVRDFRATKDKQTTAALGEALETERKGERFSLVEPPQVPTEPVRPNRLLILAAGFVLAIGAGLGTAILAEAADTAIYGARQMVAITGVSPLVVVPYIRTREDAKRAWRGRFMFIFVAVTLVVGLVVFIHTQVVPLDVLWATILRSLQTVPLLSKLFAAG